MTITLRSVKGTAALTQAELDGNFTDLDGRVTTLQSGGTGITKTGTPADNQIAVWTGANSLEGTTALTLSADLLERDLGRFRRCCWSKSALVPRQRLASAQRQSRRDPVRGQGCRHQRDRVRPDSLRSGGRRPTDLEAGRLIFLLPLNVAAAVAERDLLKLGPTAEMASSLQTPRPPSAPSSSSTGPAPAPPQPTTSARLRSAAGTARHATVDYATIKGVIADATDGTEDGSLEVQIVRAGASTTMLQVTANGVEVLTGILKLPSAGSRPTASSAGVGAVWYDPALGQPVYSNGSTWADALRGKLSADLDAAGFAIFGNRPKGFIVNGSTHACSQRTTAPSSAARIRDGSDDLTWSNSAISPAWFTPTSQSDKP